MLHCKFSLVFTTTVLYVFIKPSSLLTALSSESEPRIRPSLNRSTPLIHDLPDNFNVKKKRQLNVVKNNNRNTQNTNFRNQYPHIETYRLDEFPNDKIALHFPCNESNMFATNCACHLKCREANCQAAFELCNKYKDR